MKTVDCLELYWDGRHYDLKYRDLKEDLPFWLDQVEKYGEPVLELGCGTGRITLPLTEKGIAITGLDISEPMLSLARKKAEERGGTTDLAEFPTVEMRPALTHADERKVVAMKK